MPKTLLFAVLLSVPFAACADRGGSALVVADGPAAPINRPDTDAMPTPGENSATEPGSGGRGLPAANSNTNGSPTASSSASGSGNGQPPGPIPSAGVSPNPGSGSDPGSGGQGGSPVPEPGTLLLFGTGLAGIAGLSLRRRRKQ